jgi:hypothetical protein
MIKVVGAAQISIIPKANTTLLLRVKQILIDDKFANFYGVYIVLLSL